MTRSSSGRMGFTLCDQGRFLVVSAGDLLRGDTVHLRLEDTCGFKRVGIACRHLITIGRYLKKPKEAFDLMNTIAVLCSTLGTPSYRLRGIASRVTPHTTHLSESTGKPGT